MMWCSSDEMTTYMILREIARRVFSRGRDDRYAIELIAREGCHLCDDAFSELARVFGGANVTVTEITGRRELEDQFVFRIPVVRCNGVVLAEGVITSSDARALRPTVLSMNSDRRNG
jgi:hypothetical protein